jgi:serine/threonine-protein kinase
MSAESKHDSYLSRRGELVGGNYVLDEVLGVGGMGIVYAARQRSLDRTVALKVPRPELAADPIVRRRFRVEALASSRITHRNSVCVFDYGEHSGVPYIVMEHVAGPRLARLLVEHGPLPIGVAVRLVRQVTSALEEAHANEIVHADVKCDNILVEIQRDGGLVPRLIDWGIARLGNRRDDNDAGIVTGTPEYLAPEVVAGARPTFAADVYAVGVMLYELIAGATPFGAYKVDVELPPALDSVVQRALAREPGSRFADATMLGNALDAIELAANEHEPITTTGASCSVFATEATTASSVAPGTRSTDRRV